MANVVTGSSGSRSTQAGLGSPAPARAAQGYGTGPYGHFPYGGGVSGTGLSIAAAGSENDSTSGVTRLETTSGVSNSSTVAGSSSKEP